MDEDGGFLWEWWNGLGFTGQCWVEIGFAVVFVIGLYVFSAWMDWRKK